MPTNTITGLWGVDCVREHAPHRSLTHRACSDQCEHGEQTVPYWSRLSRLVAGVCAPSVGLPERHLVRMVSNIVLASAVATPAWTSGPANPALSLTGLGGQEAPTGLALLFFCVRSRIPLGKQAPACPKPQASPRARLVLQLPSALWGWIYSSVQECSPVSSSSAGACLCITAYSVVGVSSPSSDSPFSGADQ